ncbi:MAG: hypothetical protein ACOZIN_19755 [Myxococcota bacterium]
MRRFAAVVVLALLAACGGEGACVIDSPTGNPGWEACHDGWSAEECAERGSEAVFHGGSCEGLGYTQQCPGETGSKRLPSYSCR